MSEQTTSPKLSARTKHQLSLVEAALYVAGRPLDTKTLGSILRARSEQKIRQVARTLKSNYEEAGSALEILELTDGRFVMQLKSGFSRYVKRLATRQLLTLGPLRTLSFVALKQPVPQSYVVKVRGSLAYTHIQKLSELGLVTPERLGRTKILRTTPTFADYFNLSQDTDQMKKQLRRMFSQVTSSQKGSDRIPMSADYLNRIGQATSSSIKQR